MLETRKQITLTGNSMIDGQQVMSLTANIPSETGIGNINQYVQNPSLYDANKAQVRRDVAEFTSKVYEIEDEMAAEVPVPEEIKSERIDSGTLNGDNFNMVNTEV